MDHMQFLGKDVTAIAAEKAGIIKPGCQVVTALQEPEVMQVIEKQAEEYQVPVTVAGAVLFLAAYGLYAEVMRENAYLSRTIKVEEGQKVVDTGLYGIVRHPMYMATILLFLMIPIVLGSWYALIVFACYPAIIIVRLKDEEDLLTRELAGYVEYKQKVKYRIIPFIW